MSEDTERVLAWAEYVKARKRLKAIATVNARKAEALSLAVRDMESRIRQRAAELEGLWGFHLEEGDEV